jgi:hypothetical protein
MMMRLGRWASLLVAFSLLTSAATASAECAWVLWTYSFVRLNDTPRAFDWARLGAQTTVNACNADGLAVARGTMKQLRNKDTITMKLEPLPGGGVVVDHRFKDGEAEIRYQCYPDTVDPRGPKGMK